MSDHIVLSPKVQKQIDKLQRKLRGLEEAVQKTRREISKIESGQSPIQPGAIITWISGSRKKRGRVHSVSANYQGFTYSCYILSKDNRSIGYAEVSSQREPTLDGIEEE